jgi:hypothetical protein
VRQQVPSRLATVLRLVGWDVAPGLTLVEPGRGASEPAIS